MDPLKATKMQLLLHMNISTPEEKNISLVFKAFRYTDTHGDIDDQCFHVSLDCCTMITAVTWCDLVAKKKGKVGKYQVLTE